MKKEEEGTRNTSKKRGFRMAGLHEATVQNGLSWGLSSYAIATETTPTLSLQQAEWFRPSFLACAVTWGSPVYSTRTFRLGFRANASAIVVKGYIYFRV